MKCTNAIYKWLSEEVNIPISIKPACRKIKKEKKKKSSKLM